MKIIFSLFTGIALIACSSQVTAEPYPAKIKELFVENCSEINKDFCQCTIDEIEQRVSFDVFVDDLRKYKSKLVLERPYIDAGLSCSVSYQTAKNGIN